MDRRWWLATTAVLLAGVVIVVLALEVRALRPQAIELKRMRAFPFVGQWVPTVRAVTLQGDSVTVGETSKGRSQVLIFFTVSCPYCRQTLPAWKRITAELLADSARRHDIYWVSLSAADSTRQYVAEHGISAPVLLPPDAKMVHVYRVKGVPMTLVVDYRGRITHVHPSVISSPAGIDSVLALARQVDAVAVSAAAVPQAVLPP